MSTFIPKKIYGLTIMFQNRRLLCVNHQKAIKRFPLCFRIEGFLRMRNYNINEIQLKAILEFPKSLEAQVHLYCEFLNGWQGSAYKRIHLYKMMDEYNAPLPKREVGQYLWGRILFFICSKHLEEGEREGSMQGFPEVSVGILAS